MELDKNVTFSIAATKWEAISQKNLIVLQSYVHLLLDIQTAQAIHVFCYLMPNNYLNDFTHK